MYSIKETYYTIQGEGYHSGRAAVFLRFAGCNLWSGLEKDRHSAICKFCDTDFFGTSGEGGGKFKTAAELARHVENQWEGGSSNRYVVCTGGEPALQMDSDLVVALREAGFEIGIETNGTLPLPEGIDWICVSPKSGAEVVLTNGNELKVVVPQLGIDLDRMSIWDFDYFYLQPMDNADQAANTTFAVDLCKRKAQWRLSLQTHKILGLR